MKKLIFFVLISIASSVFADMVFDPVTNRAYCKTNAKNIDQAEYGMLCIHCLQLSVNIETNKGRTGTKELLNQVIIVYLKKIGSPTALQLLKDLKKGIIYRPDGSVMITIFS